MENLHSGLLIEFLSKFSRTQPDKAEQKSSRDAG